ncbi:hypothetical protein P261_00603 [Lachnospiraceae bacterium TWA4]|nr:hypothetical protein P261_00603 [Lachnospiraceae bacterium TWA4]
MKENAKQRSWLIALHIVFFFFALPVFGILAIQPGGVPRETVLENLLSIIGFKNYLIYMGTVGLGVLTGLNGFSYLFDRRKVDFYHSLPIKREKLYLVSYVNGLLMFVLPYVLFTLLSLAICSSMYKITGVGAYIGNLFALMGENILVYLLFYSTAILAATLVGNVVISILATGVLTLYNLLVCVLFEGLCTMFFNNYIGSVFNDFYTMKAIFNPFLWYPSIIDRWSDINTAWNMDLTKILIWTLGITVGSVIVYHFRKSEAAGNAIAFDRLKPVLRFFLTVPIALASGAMFRLMAVDFEDGWLIFGLVMGCFLTHAILQIIMEFDFKAAFKGLKCLAFCAVATFLIAGIFKFDLLGYDSWVPTTSKVQSISIYDDGLTRGLYSTILQEGRNEMTLSDESDIAKVISLVENISSYQERTNNESNTYYTSVKICYRLSFGRERFRNYEIPRQYINQFLEICNTKEYKNATYPILQNQDKEYRAIYLTGELATRNNYEEVVYELNLNSEQKRLLLSTYCKELEAMDMSLRLRENAILNIGFMEGTRESMYDDLEYPIYSSFTDTCKLLEDWGIYSPLSADFIDSVRVTLNVYDESKKVTKVFTKKEDLEKLIPALTPNYMDHNIDVSLINDLKGVDNYEVRVAFKKSLVDINSKLVNFRLENTYTYDEGEETSKGSISYQFKEGKLPKFVEEMMK